MAKTQWKGGALLAPVPPVLVSSGTMEAPNACTAGWCGMVSTHPPKTYVALRPSRFTHQLISQSAQFVLNLPTAALVKTIDYCGVKSGRDEDKLAACGLTAEASFEVEPPRIAQSPVALECRVFSVQPMGSHELFLADIVAVAVDGTLMDANGKLDLAKAGLCTYAHGAYYELGRQLGTFGFSVRKKRSKPRRPPAVK